MYYIALYYRAYDIINNNKKKLWLLIIVKLYHLHVIYMRIIRTSHAYVYATNMRLLYGYLHVKNSTEQ